MVYQKAIHKNSVRFSNFLRRGLMLHHSWRGQNSILVSCSLGLACFIAGLTENPENFWLRWPKSFSKGVDCKCHKVFLIKNSNTTYESFKLSEKVMEGRCLTNNNESWRPLKQFLRATHKAIVMAGTSTLAIAHWHCRRMKIQKRHIRNFSMIWWLTLDSICISF